MVETRSYHISHNFNVLANISSENRKKTKRKRKRGRGNEKKKERNERERKIKTVRGNSSTRSYQKVHFFHA